MQVSRCFTSASHPITVSWIIKAGQEASSVGQLGLSYCPGKKASRGTEVHNRNLKSDLKHLVERHQATTLVCLLNAAELRSLGLRDYVAGVTAAGLYLVQFPIVEMAAPESLPDTALVVEDIVARLRQGEVVIMHCRGGVGRAGLMAACVLLLMGEATTAAAAIALVRERRCPAAVESRKQEDFIQAYCTWLKQQADTTGSKE